MDEFDNSGLPPGPHPDGLLGGLTLGTPRPRPVQAAEISSPVLNPADSSFRMRHYRRMLWPEPSLHLR